SGSALQGTIEGLLDLFKELTVHLKLAPVDSESPAEDTVEEEPYRFHFLSSAMVIGPPTISSNEDDEQLVYFLSPLMPELNAWANTMESWHNFSRYEDELKFKRQVGELNARFASFKAAVEVVSRTIKRRNRDPDLHWCYYNEEWNIHARSQGRVGTSASAVPPSNRAVV
ncbi:hypothetical protein FRC01_007521, partial [Tulasnella sp. 417]